MMKGVFGKLPAHGDFVQRGLPGSFTDTWDEWLQRAVHGSRELVGAPWLDFYLTSPIWRFVLSPGVVDEKAWAGVLVPSVDSVGRYFPVTLCAEFGARRRVFDFFESAQSWYSALCDLGLSSLQDTLPVDDVMSRFPVCDMIDAEAPTVSRENDALLLRGHIDLDRGYAALAEKQFSEHHSSYSLWWNGGSSQPASSLLLSPGLPEPLLYSTMIGAEMSVAANI